MALLSFLAGLPSFWIMAKSHATLPLMVRLTSGLLLSSCINLVLPEAINNLPIEKLQSSSFGAQLLLGFIALYSIEIFSSSFSKYIHNRVSSNDNFQSLSIDDESSDRMLYADFNLSSVKYYLLSVVSNSTTLGLLLHCLTDGIILTTSLLSESSNEKNSKSSNSFLIILALFLHKLPTSFSLTSILLNEQLSYSFVLFHLFLFSISAPIGAWITYFLANIFDVSNSDDLHSFILLFSAGAFLYVSFHTFISCHKHDSDGDNNKLDTEANLNWSYLTTIIGMIIPLLVGFLHDD